MKSVFALAALAAIGLVGAAYAEDGAASTTITTAPKAMSDSDMAKVTAGGGLGTLNPSPGTPNAFGLDKNGGPNSGVDAGEGNETAASAHLLH